MNDNSTPLDEKIEPSWRPLNSRQRRVVGVLVEKAKTTPDSYPLSLNALTNGCNQKSNRSPQMNLSMDDVETIVDELREMGAVTEVQGGSRVAKYRHHMYEWLGVNKYEIAVMAELLLRGEQTVGELRGRASRMETIASLSDLKPVLQSLIEKDMVVSLTPEGRGQVVTHNLYEDREWDKVKARVGNREVAASPPAANPPASTPTASYSATPSAPAAAPGVSQDVIDELKSEIQELRDEVSRLTDRVEKFEQLLE